jgi:hypothetical protein
MKKSLLLLSLLAAGNMFGKVAAAVETTEVEVIENPSLDAAALRPAGETHEQYLESCGGQVPHVGAHQDAHQKHLHKARGNSVTRPARAQRKLTRAQRRTNKQATAQQAVRN